jgi:hypothetical protein
MPPATERFGGLLLDIGGVLPWAERAAELGAAVGQAWDTRAMIHRLYQLPRQDWLRAEMMELVTEAKAAGLRVGALTNDLTDVASARRVGMTAVRVAWDDPGPAIDTAMDLLGLPARAVDR